MKLSATIGISLGCGAAAAAAAWQFVSAPRDAGFEALSVLGTTLGGAGGIGVATCAVLSFALLTVGAIRDLGRVRLRIAQASRDSDAMPGAWQNALAGTDFETLAVHLPGEDLAIAPLARLRVLRHEIWRRYGTRLVAAQLVTVALAALALAAAPYLGPAARAPAGDMPLEAGLVAVALVAGSWLLIDEAIQRLAATLARIVSAWEASLRDQPAVPARAGSSATILSTGLSGGEPAIAAIEAALRDAAARQGALIGGLCETLTSQIAILARAVDRRGAASSGGDTAGVSEALTQLAASVDRLSDPLLRRMRLLDASDHRLLRVLRRQEEAVGSVGTKWGELVSALQAMSAGLDSFAQAAAARENQDRHLLSGDEGEPGAISDELQDLLDEMSDIDEPVPHRPSN